MSKLYIYADSHNLQVIIIFVLTSLPFIFLYILQNVPPDLSVCVFVLAQCLSVRALQEMLASREDPTAGVRVSLHSPFILSISLFLANFLFFILLFSSFLSIFSLLLIPPLLFSVFNCLANS